VTQSVLVPVPLTSLAVGACGRLHDAHLDEDTRSLLRSLGLIDASRLRVCKRGEPFIIQVRSTRIGVSGSVADAIFVIPDSLHVEHHAGYRVTA
jgi:Fe2+ transport system protein FeoA